MVIHRYCVRNSTLWFHTEENAWRIACWPFCGCWPIRRVFVVFPTSLQIEFAPVTAPNSRWPEPADAHLHKVANTHLVSSSGGWVPEDQRVPWCDWVHRWHSRSHQGAFRKTGCHSLILQTTEWPSVTRLSRRGTT
ncbi:hypothetical protein J4Q44_G00316110 [Coregonus suidteri]|uniref:Uncharacterized protein n=1 Tax=Coregonus suidteri TaxID=861788 RepID=A0AAN8L417_9TELE